ncbi:MAG TPA: acyl-CoA dehydrogenase family protein [Actinomycetota bacterium]
MSPRMEAVTDRSADVAAQLAETAAEIDRDRRFPDDHFALIAKAGLTGILVPEALGGLGGNLETLATVCEDIGGASGSTGLCFLMHACGTSVVASKATPDQAQRWLEPAAAGETLATLAFSERATGAHFYAPEISAQKSNGSFVLNGKKSFVTNGGHADLYPVLVNASGEPGLDILIVTPDLGGVSFDGEWDGVGMAGNSSIQMVLDNVEVPANNLLGNEGDGQEMVFGVVPPFLIGLAGVNVGIAQAALDAAVEHVKNRKHLSGQTLAEVPIIQEYLAEMSMQTEMARTLVSRAARAADAGEETATPLVFLAKIAATEAVIDVTNKAMQVCGGQGYSRTLPIERYWRDARAGAVMAPTNEVLKEWVGKLLAGLPLF